MEQNSDVALDRLFFNRECVKKGGRSLEGGPSLMIDPPLFMGAQIGCVNKKGGPSFKKGGPSFVRY